jgi:hypothetical protein
MPSASAAIENLLNTRVMEDEVRLSMIATFVMKSH